MTQKFPLPQYWVVPTSKDEAWVCLLRKGILIGVLENEVIISDEGILLHVSIGKFDKYFGVHRFRFIVEPIICIQKIVKMLWGKIRLMIFTGFPMKYNIYAYYLCKFLEMNPFGEI